MRRFIDFLNPIEHLGDQTYSFLFPFGTMIMTCLLSEIYAYWIVKNPMIVGMYGIFLPAALIIYFAFREGLMGGITATIVTILYYLEIIYTRRYKGEMLRSGLETTFILALLYLIISIIIGWLKQKIDGLIVRETNERRRLQSIIQQLPVGVLLTDENGRIIQGNKKIEMILGRKMRDSLVAGVDNIDNGTYHNKPVMPTQWPLAQTLMTGRAIGWKEFILNREGGKKVYLQISANLIKNKEGKVIAAASIINDVTQQKELDERKDDFVNMASHELKTPITSLKLYIESLSNRVKNYGDERALKTINGIRYQTERLQELVSDLLDVSRLQTGKLTFNKEVFDMHALVGETVEELHAANQKHKIHYAGKGPAKVQADKFRMYQALTNLITNAVKYSPEGSEITVRLRKTGDDVVVSVQDLGIGIASDQQKKIFEKLYQVTDIKEKTFPGFGMGLFITREIVRRHRGRIWVKSALHEGSTFYFSLPIKSR